MLMLLDHLLRFGLHRRLIRHIQGVDNQIEIAPCAMNQILFDIKGDHNRISIGKDCLLNQVTFHIRGNNHIVWLDEKVSFRDSGSQLWLVGERCNINVGKGTSFEQSLLAATEDGTRIVIGQDCMFAHEIDVRTSDSHSIIDIARGQRINYARNITVEDHVWVGKRAIILKGTTIGKDSMIAIGSIVTGPN